MGHAFATKLQLTKATTKHLRSVQRQPDRIRKYARGAEAMSARTELLDAGLRGCLALLSVYPNSTALQSIKAQIQYLIDLEKGLIVDQSRLAKITIGAMTAREIEALDESVAETLHKVAAIAKEM